MTVNATLLSLSSDARRRRQKEEEQEARRRRGGGKEEARRRQGGGGGGGKDIPRRVRRPWRHACVYMVCKYTEACEKAMEELDVLYGVHAYIHEVHT